MLREPEPKHMQRPLAIYTIFIQYNALIPGTLQTVHTYALSLYEDGGEPTGSCPVTKHLSCRQCRYASEIVFALQPMSHDEEKIA